MLCDYVKERNESDPKGQWDGNVAANYKTNDDPPKALGRWINRQRSNYVKKKIKKEHIDKLNKLGLKWAVHDRSRFMNTESSANAAPNTVPRQTTEVSDSNTEKAVLRSDKGLSETGSNAETCSLSAASATSSSSQARSNKEKVASSNAVMSVSSSAPEPSVTNEKRKETKAVAV